MGVIIFGWLLAYTNSIYIKAALLGIIIFLFLCTYISIKTLLIYSVVFLPLGLIPWRKIFQLESLFKMTLEDIVLIIFCFYFLLFVFNSFFIKREKIFTESFLNTLIFLYLFFVFISFFQGLINTNLVYEPFRQMKGIVYLFTFFILQKFIQTEEELKNLLSFLFFLAFVCALYQLLFIKFPFLISFYNDGYIVSQQGIVNNIPRIFFAGSTFFTPILPVLLIFGLSSKIKKNKRYILLITYFFLTIIFSLTLILNILVQNLIAMLIVLILKLKNTKNLVILLKVIVIILIILLFIYIIFPEVGILLGALQRKLEISNISLQEGNFYYRLQQIPRAWETMKNINLSFLIGVGLGTGYETDYAYEWDPTQKYRAPSLELNHINSFFLLGFLGTIVYILLILYFTFASINRYLRVRRSRWEPYQLSVVLIWIMGLINPYGGYFWYAQGTLLIALIFFVHQFVGQQFYQEKIAKITESKCGL